VIASPRRIAAAFLALACCGVHPAAAHEGWGVVVDGSGRVYVADVPANIIWRFTPGWGPEPVARGIHSHALVLGPDGAVYGTHAEPDGPRRGVWRLDMSGRLSFVVPPGDGGGMGLQSFLIGRDGAIYSASAFQPGRAPEQRTVHLLRLAKGRIDTIAGGPAGFRDGTAGAARFQAIDGMAWLPDGRMLIVDGARLRTVDLAGRVETRGPPLSVRRWDEDLLGVAVADDSTVFAADFAGGVLRRWRGAEGMPVYRRHPYWSPTGVAAAGGALYVLEHPRAPLGILGDLGVGPYLRVRRIAPNGESTVLFHRQGRNTGVAAAIVAARAGAAAFRWLRARRRAASR
jgi:hypothetical protein